RPNGEEASIRQIYREDSNFRAWLQIKPLAHFPIVLVLNLTALRVGGRRFFQGGCLMIHLGVLSDWVPVHPTT
ncbi:hypothetical protein, partial [Acanthopleuribacter pedis]